MPRLAFVVEPDYRGLTMRQAMKLEGAILCTGCAWLLVLVLAATGACGSSATQTRPPAQPAAAPPPRATKPVAAAKPTPAPDPYAVTPRPEDAEDDVIYYRERAIALKTGIRGEIARTDFARLRRGRMYLRNGMLAKAARTLDTKLGEASAKNDDAAVLDLSAQILADDQTSIRAHILRGMSLRRTGRATEADFHREFAKVLTESIVGKGDGRGFDSAWTVYRAQEEPEVLKALGCVVESQSVASHGGRRFDVLLTRKTDSGEAMELYFDVSEMFAEDVRRPGAN
jgi:hypothetical protein